MKSWDECYADPSGTIYVDETIAAETDGGSIAARGLVMRAMFSLAGYVGLPSDHPTAGWPGDLVPLDVHGGLTFSDLGDGEQWPAGWWWYGWDYGHAFDRTWLHRDLADRGVTLPSSALLDSGTAWTIEMVLPEMRAARDQLLTMALACWQPSAEAQAEEDERVRHMAEWRANPDEVMEQLEAARQKWLRLRELGQGT